MREAYREPHWMLVLPPLGRAREIGLSMSGAFQQEFGEYAHILDTQDVLRRIYGALKNEEQQVAADWLNQHCVVKALEWRVRYLVVLSLAPVFPHYLDVLRSAGVCCVHWLYEDQRIADYWRDLTKHYDLFCANQMGMVRQEIEQNQGRFRYLPLGARFRNMGMTVLPFETRTWDVAFVGARTPYRVQALERLAAAGLSLGIDGEGWNEETGILSRYVVREAGESESALEELFRQSRLIVFLSRTGDEAGREQRFLPASVWDAVALGAYPVLERISINRISLEGIQYSEFENPVNLLALCVALRHNGVAQEILEANRDAVLRAHTWNHRLRAISQWVEDLGES